MTSPRSLLRLLMPALLAAACTSAIPLRAQPGAGRVVVISDVGGATPSGLFEVDAAAGTISPLGSFAYALFEPLAIANDAINRNLVVAVRDVNQSRIVRLGFQGAAVVDEREIAVLPGEVTDLDFDTGGDLIASVDGPMGGLWRLPRAGAPAVQVVSLPYTTAFDVPYPGFGVTVQSFPIGDPTLSTIDLGAGVATPYVVPGLAGLRITGVQDMPTGAIRHGLSDDQGGLHRFEFLSVVNPWVTLPTGGSNELELDFTGNAGYFVLGGAGSPFLRTVPIFGTTSTTLAGPIPGDPKDMATTMSASSALWPFGPASCGAGAGTIQWAGSWPGLGVTTDITLVNGLPGAPAILAIGSSDFSWGGLPLPLSLPGGCSLLVSPDQTLPTTTDAAGDASFTFVVPNDPALSGLIMFGQWGQPTPTGWVATGALAAHIW